MLNIIYSNRLEKLAEIYAHRLSQRQLSIFDKEQVIVQTEGMSKWLTLKCAELNGAVSGLEFSTPVPFCVGMMKESLEREYNIPDKHALAWAVFSFLSSDQGRSSEFAQAVSYHGKDPLLTFQLSARIADLFDQYSLYRTDMVTAWDSGKMILSENEQLPDEFAWQYHLWRKIFAEYDHRGQVLSDFLQSSKIPQAKHISLFGITSLSEYVLRAYGKLALTNEIDVYVLNPSPEFWQDIRSKKEILYHSLKNGSDGYYEERNPLLASYGKLSREFLNILYDNFSDSDIFSEDDSAFSLPEGKSLLNLIQQDIYNLESSKREIIPDDSVLVHACHSPLREVEVLYDYILDAVSNDKISPENIVVMVPDISGYAPFIEAVFSSPENEKMRIPYSIADRKASSESAFINSFTDSLKFAQNRYSLSAFGAIFKSDPVKRKFEITGEDADLALKWLYEAGTRWGLDSVQREKDYGFKFSEYSWSDALQRIITGIGYGETTDSVGKYIPYYEIEGSSIKVFSAALKLFRLLEKLTSSFAEIKSISEWNDVMIEFMQNAFDTDEYYPDYRYIVKVMKQIEEAASTAGKNLKTGYDVYYYELMRQIDFDTSQRGFISGGITFCQLLPLRSVPFDFVAILGLNSGEFPRSANNLGFDIMYYKRKKGDRSVKNDDRDLFLESILSARKKLHLSYTGRDSKTNEEKPASSVLSEFINYMRDYYFGSDYKEILIREHALKGFSEKYYDGKDKRFFSYFSDRIVSHESHKNKNCAMPKINEELLSITPEMFAHFFSDPRKYYFEKKCGIKFRTLTDFDYDSEPLLLTSGMKKQNARIIESYLRNGCGYDEIEKILMNSMMLPVGNYAESAFEIFIEDFANIFEYSKNVLSSMKSEHHDILFENERICINGNYRMYSDGKHLYPVFFIFSKNSQFYETKAKVYHVMLSAIYDNVKTVIVYKDTKKEIPYIDKKSALLIMNELSALYTDYLSDPFDVDIDSAINAWTPEYDKFENHYYAKINKKSDDDFMTKENKYEDYSDLAGYHFNSDISRIYKFVSPLCSVSVANEKAGKKK
ncbi:MAG TPA: exodeoxyribonuclease V subunit gamma [Spirochaetota bacterium]|nr:exodeoxyribonuclease V subunit gamma [Spirochaetota bacterium]HOR45250.1 exodeoxyribonuclease V subunit gamma [Spirochaetota bacterium]HPK57350.1 exodeoxyribonuclease V subunit gamma [Spirochaetota bacterium]